MFPSLLTLQLLGRVGAMSLPQHRSQGTHNTMTPTDSLTNALLTDMYQITMAYAYFRTKRHETTAVFDLFFRKNPFDGEYTIFAGLSEIIAFMDSYKFTEEHIAFLKEQMPAAGEDFFDYLRNLDCSQVKVHAFQEGSVVFPRQPLLRIEGPIGICQLLETTLLCIVNYASLVATNAARMRMAVGPSKTLLEFGLRRAQGPNGGVSATRYAYVGGFDGTSNALAGMMFGMKVGGTHAHSFVQSFSSLEDLPTRTIEAPDGSGRQVDIVEVALKYRQELEWEHTNAGLFCVQACLSVPTCLRSSDRTRVHASPLHNHNRLPSPNLALFEVT